LDFNFEQQEKKIHQIFFYYIQPLFPENRMNMMLTEEERNIFTAMVKPWPTILFFLCIERMER